MLLPYPPFHSSPKHTQLWVCKKNPSDELHLSTAPDRTLGQEMSTEASKEHEGSTLRPLRYSQAKQQPLASFRANTAAWSWLPVCLQARSQGGQDPRVLPAPGSATARLLCHCLRCHAGLLCHCTAIYSRTVVSREPEDVDLYSSMNKTWIFSRLEKPRAALDLTFFPLIGLGC